MSEFHGVGAVGDVAENDDTEWTRVLDVDVGRRHDQSAPVSTAVRQ
ncbi:hypothetical protein ACFYWX_26025 [Streptomyces sp. NPDC002888]